VKLRRPWTSLDGNNIVNFHPAAVGRHVLVNGQRGVVVKMDLSKRRIKVRWEWEQ